MRIASSADVLADIGIRRCTGRILVRQSDMSVARSAKKNRSASVFLAGDELAAAQRIMDRLSDQLAEIRKRKGTLTGDSKQRVLEAIERLRGIVLKWPAWATPATGKKPRR